METVTTRLSHRALPFLPFAGVAVLLAIPLGDDGPTVCPFAICTGMACPGCGMTRAASHLVRGDLATAAGYHPLVFLIAAQAAAGWLWLILRRRGVVRPLPHRVGAVIAMGTAAALVGVWSVRLLLGTLPPV